MQLVEYSISHADDNKNLLTASTTHDLTDWLQEIHKAAEEDTRECTFQSDSVEAFTLFKELIQNQRSIHDVSDRLSTMLLEAIKNSSTSKKVPKCRFTICIDEEQSEIILSLANYNKILDETHTKRRGPAFDKKLNQLRSCVITIQNNLPSMNVKITGTQDYWIIGLLGLKVSRSDLDNSTELFDTITAVFNRNLVKHKSENTLLTATLVHKIRNHGSVINVKEFIDEFINYHPDDPGVDISSIVKKLHSAVDVKIKEQKLDLMFNCDKNAVAGKHSKYKYKVKKGIDLTVELDNTELKKSVYRAIIGHQLGIFIPIEPHECESINWTKPIYPLISENKDNNELTEENN